MRARTTDIWPAVVVILLLAAVLFPIVAWLKEIGFGWIVPVIAVSLLVLSILGFLLSNWRSRLRQRDGEENKSTIPKRRR